MERKFESDIGVRISEGDRRRSSGRVGILAAVAISCALLMGSAAFLLPAMSSAEEGNVVSVDICGAMDYLVYNEDNDCLIHYDDFSGEYDVKESMNLRAMAYPPSANAPSKYVKFIYTTTAHLDVVDYLGDTVVLGNLEIPYVSGGIALGAVPLTWSVTVNGVTWNSGTGLVDEDGVSIGFASSPAIVTYDGAFLAASVCLPTLLDGAYVPVVTEEGTVYVLLPSEYQAEDDVQIQVYFKVTSLVTDDIAGALLGIKDNVVVDAFPDFADVADLPVAIGTAEPTSVAMGDSVALDASASENVDEYAWYFGGTLISGEAVTTYTFATQLPGDYTFVLKVWSTENLVDIAEVVVTVCDEEAPVAEILVSAETEVETGMEVTFDGSGSDDNVGIVSWAWTIVLLDDCQAWYYNVEEVTYTFTYPGEYTIRLAVSDAAGNVGLCEIPYVLDPPLSGEELVA